MKDNELIAQFMGLQKTDIGWYDSEEVLPPLSSTYDSNTYDPHELAFDRSWDWLMPVVEKIERENSGVPNQMIDLSLFSTIDEVYSAVVEFIKWYNNQN